MIQYTCGQCGGIFVDNMNEEEALAEEKKTFGCNSQPENRSIVCDDCYQEILKFMGKWRRIIELRYGYIHMYITDEHFMEELAQAFPNEDWNNLPDIETIPDIYVVEGKFYEKGWRNPNRVSEVHFRVGAEFLSMTEAELQIEICKKWDDVVPGTLKILKMKPAKDVDKLMCKEFRERILKGEKVFPMYLP